MDDKGLERLQKLKELNANPTWINSNLYRLMYREDLYVIAYERIKSAPGNMTEGADGSTLDGFSMNSISKIIGKMKDQSFQFTAARRIYIPKANGKERPLGIPSPKDKIVQEVMRMILECIYDGDIPSFLESSHGFRPNRGTHSCLKEVRGWHAVNWFVEGDIRGCFDNVHHSVLIKTLSKRIKDQRFLDLIWKALRAGYMEKREFANSLIGTPQGSILSPILANIYLHEFDLWVENFKGMHEKGKSKRTNPAYTKIVKERKRVKEGRKEASAEERRNLEKTLRQTPSRMHNDPNYIRVKYVRYADDWLVAIDGPRELAETFKVEATEFFLSKLGLELSDEKTHIRNARKEEAHFLGTNITVAKGEPKFVKTSMNGIAFKKRVNVDNLTYMTLPKERILKRFRENGFIDGDNNPITKTGWIHKEDWEIVQRYSEIIRGYRNYYSFVDNPRALHHLRYLLQYSCAKTLCRKRQTSLRKLMSKHGVMLRVPKKLDTDGKPLTWTELDLSPIRKNRMGFLSKNEGPNDIVGMGINLLTRTKLGEPCVICGKTDGIEMHHVRHLRKGKAKGFTQVLQQINRKQIPVCKGCHLDIHDGKHDGKSLSDLYHPKIASR